MKRRVKLHKDKEKKEKDKYIEDLVAGIEEDFEKRRKERLHLERQWELNINFLNGNQYCGLNSRGEIESDGKDFYWQSRLTYNHIAPIIDSRQAKFSRLEPNVSVRPRSDDDSDVTAATLSEKLILGAFKSCDFSNVAKKVTTWSETCGTGFYKVVWNNLGGNSIGELDGRKVYEGDVNVLPVSPFEIFPDSLYVQEIEDCASIIHARALSVEQVKEIYGISVKGDNISIYGLKKQGALAPEGAEVMENAVVVIERYERPTTQYPNGRLITVAGGKLLYSGELPYVLGENKRRAYPFVKQVCLPVAGNFFGTSIVERLIPIQRAFNAVKNRKHEFMNRLSMGIMTVEDGSVDVDDLSQDGLSPGKVLVYRQGSKAPEIMSDMTMPSDFNEEENKLINEFVIVSGVSDVSSSASNATLTSGTALEILVEQDNSRLITSAEEIRRAYLCVAKMIVRLYAQFTEGVRAVRGQDEFFKTRVYYVDERAISSDDVYLDSENELFYTHSQKKEMIFKLFSSGLLFDEDGVLRPSTKEKVLSLLGYKDLDYQKGLSRLQEEKAQWENEKIRKVETGIEEIDDDTIHVDEHVRYVLSEYADMSKEEKQRFYNHIALHKERIKKIKGEN